MHSPTDSPGELPAGLSDSPLNAPIEPHRRLRRRRSAPRSSARLSPFADASVRVPVPRRSLFAPYSRHCDRPSLACPLPDRKTPPDAPCAGRAGRCAAPVTGAGGLLPRAGERQGPALAMPENEKSGRVHGGFGKMSTIRRNARPYSAKCPPFFGRMSADPRQNVHRTARNT